MRNTPNRNIAGRKFGHNNARCLSGFYVKDKKN